MTERYWDAGDAPEALLNWLDENIVAAVTDCWGEHDVQCLVEKKDDRLVFKILGPEMPTGEVLTLRFDLLSELKSYIEDEDNEGITALRKLTDDITALCDRAE